MNERIKELALRVIKLTTPQSLYGRTDYTVMTEFELEKFVELIRADEREACAKLCEELVLEHPGRADKTADQCAEAIRARGLSHGL